VASRALKTGDLARELRTDSLNNHFLSIPIKISIEKKAQKRLILVVWK
jgi:hypothetical protein